MTFSGMRRHVGLLITDVSAKRIIRQYHQATNNVITNLQFLVTATIVLSWQLLSTLRMETSHRHENPNSYIYIYIYYVIN
jgi:hypothetical protein